MILDELLEVDTLGDLVCIEGDCAFGRTAVKQLRAFFDQAGAPPAFAQRVATVEKTLSDTDGFGLHQPFSTVCCLIKQVGLQAQALQAELAQATGVAAPPLLAPSASQFGLVDALKLAAVGAGAWWLYQRLSKKG